jgi:predicted RND superfamily exporter protein
MAIFAFGLERLGLATIRWPKLAIVVLGVVTLAALYGMTQIRFDDELRRLFRSDRAMHLAYDTMNRDFPAVENQLLLLAESDRPFDATRLEALRNLHLDLQFSPRITGVLSMFSARHAPDADGNARPYFPADIPAGAPLANILDKAKKHPLIRGKLLSDDTTAALIVISTPANSRNYQAISGLLTEVNSVISKTVNQPGLKISLTGSPALRHEILSAIRTDLQVLNALGALIAIVVCFLFFRQPVLVLIASLPPLVSVAWTLGGFGLWGQPVTALNNVLPSLVLVIAFSDALHMVQTIRRRLAAGEDIQQALTATVKQVGPACAMTSLTTMIACLSLTLSGSDAVREFGQAGALAVFGAYLAVITFIPTTAILLLRDKSGGAIAADFGLERVTLAWCARAWRLIEARAGLIALAVVPVLILTGTLYFKIATSYDYREYLAQNSNSIFVLIERRSGAKPAPEQVVYAVHEALAGQQEFRNLLSIKSVEQWSKSDSQKLPAYLAQRLVSKDKTAWLVTINIPATPAPQTRSMLARLDGVLAPLRARFAGYTMMPTGIIAISAIESAHLIEGLKLSLLAAVLITIFIIALTSRAIVPGLLSAVPNLLSLTIVASALFVLGLSLQITSVLALTIAFGIAVDNTIHLINRYRIEHAVAPPGKALEATLLKAGPVLIAATAVLSFGLGVTQLSALPMFQLFGRLCILVLLTALIAAVVILPAMILVTARKSRAP